MEVPALRATGRIERLIPPIKALCSIALVVIMLVFRHLCVGGGASGLLFLLLVI